MEQKKLIELNTALSDQYIDFKVKQIKKSKKGDVFALLLPYKDARVDMDRLDAICTPGHWQVEYKRDTKGVLQCGIGIYVDELSQWAWKWSNGTPSDFESEKGEYSDAFKRAGFMWGIGRMLYEFPKIIINLNDSEFYEKGDKIKQSFGFDPNDRSRWKWELNEDYTKVVASMKYGNTWTVRFNLSPYKK